MKQLFQSALQYPPDRRAAFLDAACASDPTLRSEVDSLISSNDQAGDSIEAMAGDAAAQMLADARGSSFIGRNIGPYKIITEIGRGGMGNVFLAEDPRLNRRIALKLLPEEFAQNRDRLRRFQREARAVSALNHPNILTIHEVGQIDSLNFIVSEFIEGGTLRNRIRSQRLSVREALGIAIQIASALAAAHKAGIVHRDVKPENVMLREDGILKVLDFGLAKLTQRQSTTTDTDAPTAVNLTTDPGAMMGTVNYMSPEQARGLDVDERTDIFSLGVLTYEMITGQRPFEAETTSDVIVSLLTTEPAPIASFGTEVPADLERMVGRCLKKSPESRYQSAQELLDDLEHLRRDLDSGVAVKLAESGERRGRAFIRRHLLLLIIAVSIASVFVYLLAYRAARAGTFGEIKSINAAVESIAVLPLANAGTDPEMEYLGDALTEGLIVSLSHITNLKVIALASVLRYKGQEVDPPAVGRELSVNAVLRGRIIQQGDGLSISVELMDARDGTHLWDKQYDRKLTDLLSAQQDIAREILVRLRPRLTGKERQAATNSHTPSAEAYQLYLKGSYFLDRNDEASIQRAREYFQQAIEKDPGYALAYTGLADSHKDNPDVASAEAAKAAVMKALEIDSSLGEAHISLAGILWHRDWNFADAEQEFDRGLELNPSYA
ncbi:MAG TPA: protein kinase, partial [Blastocatellia bacterium]|nr:protein kinase [Blastocatellia bacterium]